MPINLTAEKLAQMIAVAVNNALMAQKINKKSTKSTETVDGKTERQLQLDIAVVKAFKKAGFKSVTPRVDVQTYNRRLAEGYKVKPGEKSVKVKQFRLFHKSQVEFVGQPSKAQQRADGEAAMEQQSA